MTTPRGRHALMENRNGLVVEAELTRATGMAECEAALAMLDRRRPFDARKAARRITLGGDKLFDRWDFVTALKGRKITPHIAVQGHKSKTGKPRTITSPGNPKIDARKTPNAVAQSGL